MSSLLLCMYSFAVIYEWMDAFRCTHIYIYGLLNAVEQHPGDYSGYLGWSIAMNHGYLDNAQKCISHSLAPISCSVSSSSLSMMTVNISYAIHISKYHRLHRYKQQQHNTLCGRWICVSYQGVYIYVYIHVIQAYR